ncbi:hypothetical protein [Rickettsiella massiliensis]|uniref:hypothetical protein n=1 Tax=Rickettsiella massiliensis TaxID=676517 RepID=UPI00029AF0B3|nr:hypothetical protein [Rickettsiella massiliensis]
MDVENLDEIFEITSLIVTTLIEKELENIIRTQFKNENSFIFNPDKILRIIDNILEHGLNFKNYRKYAGYEQLRDEEKLISS